MMDSYFNKIVDQIIVERNKQVNDAVIAEIRKIADEQGITRRIILHERAIVAALKNRYRKSLLKVAIRGRSALLVVGQSIYTMCKNISKTVRTHIVNIVDKL